MAAKGPVKGNEHRFSLGSKLLLSNPLSMLNKNLTGFVQSLFSVQSICTVRKGSASRVVLRKQNLILVLANKKCFFLESKTFLLPGHKFCVQNICFPV